MTKTVNCPQCDRAVPWNEQSKWKPFCSERCKLFDLGDWATENNRIAGPSAKPPDPDLDDYNPSDYH